MDRTTSDKEKAVRTDGGLYERMTRGAPLAVLLAAGLFVAYQLFWPLLPILQLIIIAMLLGLVLRVAVNKLKQLGAPPWLAVIIMLVGLGAFSALVALVMIPNLVREIQTLINDVPSYLESLRNLLQGIPYVPDLGELLDRLQSYLSQFLSQLTSWLPSFVSSLVWVLGGIVAAVFLAIYMAASPGPLVSGSLRLVPKDRREVAEEFIEILGERLRGWILGTLLVSLFVGVGAGLGLWSLGVPLALTFGVIAGVLNIVPYLGSTLGALLPALVALTISPVKALLVVLLFIILNQIEGNILQPNIMGRQVHAHPAMILISLLVLGVLLGPIVGALLAVPAAVFVGVLIEELTSKSPSLGDGEESEDEPEDKNAPDDSRAR